MLRTWIALALLCLALPLAACDCGEGDPPPGDPYTCGAATDAGTGSTTCRVGEACVERMGGMTGFFCAPDEGCLRDLKPTYCPTATGSVFCTADVVFPLVAPPDGGPATTTQSRVLCQF
jgi:hypothetical protein